jgi:hypothetical protein
MASQRIGRCPTVIMGLGELLHLAREYPELRGTSMAAPMIIRPLYLLLILAWIGGDSAGDLSLQSPSKRRHVQLVS